MSDPDDLEAEDVRLPAANGWSDTRDMQRIAELTSERDALVRELADLRHAYERALEQLGATRLDGCTCWDPECEVHGKDGSDTPPTQEQP